MLEKACDVAYPLAPSDRTSFGIADLAAEFRITARALRFYEDQGLISPRREDQMRIYSRRDRARLAWVLHGRSAGFSLSEIRELFDLYDLGDARADMLRLKLEHMRAMIDRPSRFADSLEKPRT